MVWDHLATTKSHVGYALISIFSIVFSLLSFVIKEKLYIGESTISTIYGIIIGPHCLNWFDPNTWGNRDSIILELSRILLCIQIFATAVELPKKYLLKHYRSVVMLLIPIMTIGWLSMGFLTYAILPGISISEGLLLAACITSTDPVLSQSIITGNFAKEHVPKHLRNLIGCESGCNDGMAFPFIYISINMIVFHGSKRVNHIVKDWICVTILYECVVGCIIGVFIGYTARHSIKFAVKKNTIDRESFLAFYLILAVLCAGIGSILQVDDLLVSFAAGAAFSWDGWFSKKTKETGLSSVIDLILNYGYFIIFGAIIPWKNFNSHYLGLDVWRLILLAFVMIFLKRIPGVLLLWKLIPDLKNFREAVFTSVWGTTGVGAIYASILARMSLEEYTNKHDEGVTHHTPLSSLPPPDSKYYRIIYLLWPVVTFWVVVSIIVHGTTVAVFMLGKKINSISVSRTWTVNTRTLTRKTNKTANSEKLDEDWMNRLPKEEQVVESDSNIKVSTSNDDNEELDIIGRKTRDNDDDGASISDLFSTANSMKRNKPKRHNKTNKLMKKINKIKYKRQKLLGIETDLDKNMNKLGEERQKREEAAANDAFKLGPQLESGNNDNNDFEEGINNDEEDYESGRYFDDDFDSEGEYLHSEDEEEDEDLQYDTVHLPPFLNNEDNMESEEEASNSRLNRRLSRESKEEATDSRLNRRLSRESKEEATDSRLNKILSRESTRSKKSVNNGDDILERIYSIEHSSIPMNTYEVGNDIIMENEDGDVINHINIQEDKQFNSAVELDKNTKYYGYIVGNKYLIENENGDTIKKYNIVDKKDSTSIKDELIHKFIVRESKNKDKAIRIKNKLRSSL
ncbi:hypothetical protein FOG51_02406 [Hanseniaspora uvarum]|nr:hypothetical protein FOG51_02406 [Hanseniaspora uvarum]